MIRFLSSYRGAAGFSVSQARVARLARRYRPAPQGEPVYLFVVRAVGATGLGIRPSITHTVDSFGDLALNAIWRPSG